MPALRARASPDMGRNPDGAPALPVQGLSAHLLGLDRALEQCEVLARSFQGCALNSTNDVIRAAGQQAVREASGRRATVESPTPGDVNGEHVEGGVELVSTTTHESWRRPGHRAPEPGRRQL